MSDEAAFDARIAIPPPTAESFERAASDVLAEAEEMQVGERGVKVFRGADGLYLQGPDEPLGTRIDAAPRQAQDELMDAAAYVRAVRREEEGRRYVDPANNPLIKVAD